MCGGGIHVWESLTCGGAFTCGSFSHVEEAFTCGGFLMHGGGIHMWEFLTCGGGIHVWELINVQGSKHIWRTHVQLPYTVINIQLPSTVINTQLPYTVINIQLPYTVINVQQCGNYHVPNGSYMVATQELYGSQMNVPSTCEQLSHVSILEHVKFPCRIPI